MEEAVASTTYASGGELNHHESIELRITARGPRESIRMYKSSRLTDVNRLATRHAVISGLTSVIRGFAIARTVIDKTYQQLDCGVFIYRLINDSFRILQQKTVVLRQVWRKSML